MIYDLIQKAKRNGLLYEAGWSRKFLDTYISDYRKSDWLRVFTPEEYEELKSFQEDMNTALDGIEAARKERYHNGTATREDIERLLDKHIKAEADHWGENYIYTKWAREHKTTALDAYDRHLEPVHVAKLDWHYEDGCDFEDWLYTDGTIRTSVYGAS